MNNDYKSPLKKLVVFFEKSRNQWKEKTLTTKVQLKIAKNRIKFLESSKSELKDQVKSLKEDKKKLEIQLETVASQQSHDNIKKELSNPLMNFQQNLPRHQYSCSHILLWISLVITTSTSMRCASRVINLLSIFLIYLLNLHRGIRVDYG